MTDMQYLGVVAMMKEIIKAKIAAGATAAEILQTVEDLEKTLKDVKKDENRNA